ncbi:ankyrin repeat-containing protein At5g02620-like [Rhododendron vialii]|uniref:ankyrin repeat-containing protein At5g02620-like n=1 Tax=Rhododendron vialii TaxID=182163 RepID=UPI00265F96C4|nr:ankyrin repeat-containing protein At5g02620-like [Rhododendron vialii]
MDQKLYKAAKEGDLIYLPILIDGRNITEEKAMRIQRGKFLKRTQHGNNNILHIAARAGRDTFVAEALRCFPFLSDQVNSQGDTPLIVAARFGHLQVVKTLADPNNELPMQDDMATAVENGTNQRSSPRQRDVEKGLVDHQLEQGTVQDNVAIVENETNSSNISHRQRDVEEGLLDDQLKQATSLENETNSRDMTTTLKNVTNSSSSHHQRDAEEVLVDRQLIHGTTALHEALRNGHEEVARYLLKLDPEMATLVNAVGESPLFLAAESRCKSFMLDILQSNRSYSTKGPDGLNVLHVARDCPGKIINKLIRRRPHLMRKLDDRGKAAIHHAVEAYYWDLLEEMLKTDPSIALFPDAEGYTALLRASSSGCWKICEKILQVCPESIEARIDKGQHALHLANHRNMGKIPPEIWELINVGDDEGNTPLHLAVKQNHYEKAILLTSSASIELGAVNKEGLTALDLCESDWQHTNFKRLIWFHLRSHGASRGRHPNEHKVPVGGTHSNIRSRDEDRKPIINTLALVAALIATLTFAAAFTMPGGYDSDSSHPNSLGVATLAKKAALKVFLVSDTLAMCCSILAVFLLLRAMRVEQDVTFSLTNTSSILLRLSFYATLVAFISGIFAVIAPKALWVAIVVCIICSMAPFLFFPTRVERNSSFLTLFRPSILIKDFQRLIQNKDRMELIQMDKKKGVLDYVRSLFQKLVRYSRQGHHSHPDNSYV